MTQRRTDLQALRKQCHEVFDEVWKTNQTTREEAYRLLARAMGKKLRDTHFSSFTEEECHHALTILKGTTC